MSKLFIKQKNISLLNIVKLFIVSVLLFKKRQPPLKYYEIFCWHFDWSVKFT